MMLHTVESLGDKLSPFIRRLFQGEKRILLPDIGNEVYDDKKFFVVTKEHIYCPYGIPTPEHEVAHAVEMKDKKRWLLPDWGLATLPFIQGNPIKAVKNGLFFAAMSREVRVRAIEMLMVPSEMNNKSSTRYNILNNEHAWGGEYTKTRLPYGRFKTYEDVQTWVHDLREKTLRAWSLERIEYEWKIRFDHMREYMELKAA